MKKMLIGTAVAGMIVGTFSSLAFAAPQAVPLHESNGAIINVAEGCGPYGHRIHFRDRFGRLVAGRCVPNEYREGYRDYYRYRY